MGSPTPPDPIVPRVFLDASVIIAGLASSTGASHAILVLSELGLVQPVVCPYLLEEVERNLASKVPEFLPTYRRLLDSLNWDTVSDPTAEEVLPWLAVVPVKDVPVLAAAVKAAPHRFVTLDTRHFIAPAEVAVRSGLTICTPSDLLKEIRALLARGFGGET